MRGFRLPATAAVVVLAAQWATPAQAQTRYNTYPIFLNCGPGFDLVKQTTDPNVLGAYIAVDPNTGWRVGYRLSNGQAAFRQNQYNMSPGIGTGDHTFWTGSLRKQPLLTMRGEMYHDEQDRSHFTYEEQLWNEKNELVLHTKADCRRVMDFATMTPMPSGPYETTKPPVQQYQPPIKVQAYRPSIPEQDSVPIKVIANSSWVDVTFGTAYNVPLPMLIDTGAGLVSLPLVAARALIETGKAHWSGRSETFTMADGSTHEKQILIIHRLNIGSHPLTNVEASVEPNDDATPLLSFSVLSQIGKFTIDTDAGTLTFG